MNATTERAGIAGDASSELKAMQQAFFSWHEQQAPEFSTDVGSTAYNDRLANLSTAVFHTQYVRRVLTLFPSTPATYQGHLNMTRKLFYAPVTVSYTHLTLPTSSYV